MTLAIRMVREFGPDVYHIDVKSGGVMEVLGGERLVHPRAAEEIMAASEKRKRASGASILEPGERSPAPGAQLLTIRFLASMGWRVCEPTLWGEANG